MNPPPALPIREGEIIAGRYRIDRVLGVGGMGVVVAAEHTQLRQRVAIKFLLPDAEPGTGAVERFMREAQAAARIQSEHVARVLDVATLNDSVPYIVLEFLEGHDLSKVLAERGPLPLEDAVGYILQACEGVAEAHAAGIVHRDLKPSNLFVCDRGGGRTVVKVLDFGISKSLSNRAGEGQLELTRTHAALGSPLYMSPEQMSSAKHVDARTDVWSLGVTLFELVCARTPFVADSITELVAKVLNEQPALIQEFRPNLPPEFSGAVARALEKDRSRRYGSVAELAAAIAPFGPCDASVSVERIARVLSSVIAAPPPPLNPGAELSAVSPAFSTTTPVSSAHPRGGGDSFPGTISQPRPGARTMPGPSAWNGRVLAVGLAVFAIAGVAGVLGVGRGSGSRATDSGAQPLSQVPVAQPPSVATIAMPPLAPPPVVLSSHPDASSAFGDAGDHGAAAASGNAGHHTAPSGAHPKAPATHSATAVIPPAPTPVTATAAGPEGTNADVGPGSHAPPASAPPACHVVQYMDQEGETRFKQVCP
ncbi:MAG: protein kinase [Polyangiaceae bacterium]|nr:protein kinase [Polyangiaceae bacterium]